MKRRRVLIAGLVVAVLLSFQAAALGTTLHAVMNVRTAQGAVGWATMLNLTPMIGVPLYWLIGDDGFEEHVSARREQIERLAPLTRRIRADVEEFTVSPNDAPGARREAKALHELAQLPALGHNDITLLVDGGATFDSLLDGLRSAERYILMQWYIVRDDALGREVQRALIERARRGVDVYFLFDAFGARHLGEDYLDSLEEAGVRTLAFRTYGPWMSRLQFNFRNHRKVTVVDGRIAWIGGHNLGDEYLHEHERLSPWRDAHVRIEGPAALAPQLSFVNDWSFMSGETLPLDWQPVAPEHGADTALVVTGGPAGDMESMRLAFVDAINSAEDRLWIASPYFVPDQSLLGALQLAALRGVDVRILLPELYDHFIVYLAAHAFFEEAATFGVKLYLYEDGFMHRKSMLIDDAVAAVGSANLDNRSMRLNFEITGFFYTPGVIQQVEAMFLNDFRKARSLEDDPLAHKPLWFRFAAEASRLGAPLL